MSLFEDTPLRGHLPAAPRPLAERMRPETLDEYVGQQHILGPGKALRIQIETDEISSMILWGPPGVGKTSLARLIAHITRAHFAPFSAVLAGVKEIKAVMAEAERVRRLGHRTVLFVDEIHRFNKAQQDAFLPYVESGDIVLIGATTENPSFEVISALLSRAKVYILKALTVEEVRRLLRRALKDRQRGLGERNLQIPDELLDQIAIYSNGDARSAYNALELVAVAAGEKGEVTAALVEDALQRKMALYDKSGEEHFNLISALHKSVRSSDADAALYWLGRMLEAGEDRLYIARRMVRMAIEDIGLADPRALEQAVAAQQAVHFLGTPEGDLALGQVAVYLSVAAKSDSTYRALKEVRAEILQGTNPPVPFHLRNAPTQLMRDVGYSEGYQHAHDVENAIPEMDCLPAELAGRQFYVPTRRGFEGRITERLEQIRQWKGKRSTDA